MLNNHADQPATQADIDQLAQATSNSFDRVEKDIATIKQDVGTLKQDVGTLKQDVSELKQNYISLHRGQEAILKIVASIDGQLKEQRDLPSRVERLEQDVFKLQTSR